MHESVGRRSACSVFARAPAELSARLQSGTGLGVVILGERRVGPREDGAVVGDLDADGTAEFFYECATREGIRLGVRSGDPIAGEDRWHADYQLGYTVEPTCREQAARSVERIGPGVVATERNETFPAGPWIVGDAPEAGRERPGRDGERR